MASFEEEMRPPGQGSDNDVDARASYLGVEPVLRLVEEQATGEALTIEHGRHPLRAPASVGTDHDPVACAGELTQPTARPAESPITGGSRAGA